MHLGLYSDVVASAVAGKVSKGVQFCMPLTDRMTVLAAELSGNPQKSGEISPGGCEIVLTAARPAAVSVIMGTPERVATTLSGDGTESAILLLISNLV